MNTYRAPEHSWISIRLWFQLIWSVALVFPAPSLSAAGVTLAWDPSPEPEAIGYRLYCAEAPAGTPFVIDVGDVVQYTVTGLIEGQTYSFYATVYSAFGDESGPSDPVQWTVPPSPRITSVTSSGYGVVLTWTSVAGGTYRVVYKESLTDLVWLPLSEPITAAGSATAYADPVGGQGIGRRYYAVQWLTP